MHKIHTRFAIARLLAFCMLFSFACAGGILTGLSPPMSLGGQSAGAPGNEALTARSSASVSGVITGTLSAQQIEVTTQPIRAEKLGRISELMSVTNRYGSLSLPPGAVSLLAVIALNITALQDQLKALKRKVRRWLNATSIKARSLLTHHPPDGHHRKLTIWPEAYRTNLPPNSVAGAFAPAEKPQQSGVFRDCSRPPYYAMDQCQVLGRRFSAVRNAQPLNVQTQRPSCEFCANAA